MGTDERCDALRSRSLFGFRWPIDRAQGSDSRFGRTTARRHAVDRRRASALRIGRRGSRLRILAGTLKRLQRAERLLGHPLADFAAQTQPLVVIAAIVNAAPKTRQGGFFGIRTQRGLARREKVR